MVPVLQRVGWRFLLRRPWQTFLMVLGIALGVAVVVSIDLANASAERAFELSTQTVAGKATHQVTGGPQGLDDRLFLQIKMMPGAQASAPVIDRYVSSPQLGNQPLQLLGIDPFSEGPFRSYLGGGTALDTGQLSRFLTQPGALLISAGNAARYGLKTGDRVTLSVDGNPQPAFIVGLVDPSDTLSRRTLDGLILADISTAQELTGRVGRLDRIDLILPQDSSLAIGSIKAILPADASVSPVAARQGTVEQMTQAFRTNLTALSLLALVVGLFLIYNSMTFSVVQRRPLFGTLRCLGVTRGEVFRMVAVEALAVGVIGSVLGLGLGVLLGQSTVKMVSQTVNDLYFTTTVRDVGLPVVSVVKGALMGVFATLLTSLPPAWEAASVPPRAALSRSGLESQARVSVRRAAVFGVGSLLLGAVIFALPGKGLGTGFAGTFAVVLGFALFSALVLLAFAGAVLPLTGKLFGMLGRMAPRNLVNSLSRTSVAVASLMVAVAVTIGVSLMIGSFRYTVVVWLAQSLQGDVYVSAPGFNSNTAAAEIDPRLIAQIERTSGVARTDLLRVANVDSPLGMVNVAASSNQQTGLERLYMTRDGAPDQTWQAMENGAVVISEPLANRLNIPSRGGKLDLSTPQGLKTFPVVGIYYDYSSSEGKAVMALDVYRRLWQDDAVTALALRLSPGSQADEVTRAIQDELAREAPGSQQLIVRPNAELRRDVMAVFDRTFAITGALNILATLVAFVGVLSSLLLLQLEKQREVGILRALGLTARQLWGLVMLETGLMGIAAGLLAMPTGYTLSLILVYIINRRSFGWTLQMALTPWPFLEALAVAVTAALLAGIYPAYREGKMPAADAIRYE